MNLKRTIITSAGGILLLAAQAHAQSTSAVQSWTGGSLLSSYDGTVGWEFTVSSDIAVNSLGYDTAIVTNGGQGSVPVGLWAVNDGTLLATATITTSSTTAGSFSYETLGSSVELTPGQDYIIGGFFSGSGLSNYGYISSLDTAPEISYVEDQYIYTGSLSMPTNTFTPQEIGFMGVNFQFQDAAVPEPTTMALAALGGAAILGLRRRK